MSFSNIPRSYRFRIGGVSLGLRSMRSEAGMSLLGLLRGGERLKLKSGNLLGGGSAVNRKTTRTSVSKLLCSDRSEIGAVDGKVSSGLTAACLKGRGRTRSGCPDCPIRPAQSTMKRIGRNSQVGATMPGAARAPVWTYGFNRASIFLLKTSSTGKDCVS